MTITHWRHRTTFLLLSGLGHAALGLKTKLKARGITRLCPVGKVFFLETAMRRECLAKVLGVSLQVEDLPQFIFNMADTLAFLVRPDAFAEKRLDYLGRLEQFLLSCLYSRGRYE